MCWSCHVEQFLFHSRFTKSHKGITNEPFLALHKNNCCQPSIFGAIYKICVIFSSLCTLSQPTGMLTSNACCAVCGKSFKRLQSHLAHNLACKFYCMLCVNAVGTEAPNIPNKDKMNTTKVSQGANHRTFPNLRSSLCKSSAIVREAGDLLHHAKDLNVVSTS